MKTVAQCCNVSIVRTAQEIPVHQMCFLWLPITANCKRKQNISYAFYAYMCFLRERWTDNQSFQAPASFINLLYIVSSPSGFYNRNKSFYWLPTKHFWKFRRNQKPPICLIKCQTLCMKSRRNRMIHESIVSIGFFHFQMLQFLPVEWVLLSKSEL